jgi:hypothetical protein
VGRKVHKKKGSYTSTMSIPVAKKFSSSAVRLVDVEVESPVTVARVLADTSGERHPVTGVTIAISPGDITNLDYVSGLRGPQGAAGADGPDAVVSPAVASSASVNSASITSTGQPFVINQQGNYRQVRVDGETYYYVHAATSVRATVGRQPWSMEIQVPPSWNMASPPATVVAVGVSATANTHYVINVTASITAVSNSVVTVAGEATVEGPLSPAAAGYITVAMRS